MMMSDRREDPKEGLLLYLKDQPNMSPVSAEHQNKRGIPAINQMYSLQI